MHPLQELERHYIDVRRQVEDHVMPPAEGIRLVRERTVRDAAGIVWCVDTDPHRSTADRAAFVAVMPDGTTVAADPSSFAFQAAAPATEPQPQPAASPQPTPGGFMFSSSPSQVTRARQAPPVEDTPAPNGKGRGFSRKNSSGAEPKKVKEPKLNTKTPKLKGSRMPSIPGLSSLKMTPLTIGIAAGAFLLVAVLFVFLRSGGDSAPATTSTTVTNGTVTTPATDTTLPVSVPSSDTTSVSVPTSDTAPATVPVVTTPPITQPVTAPTTPVSVDPNEDLSEAPSR